MSQTKISIIMGSKSDWPILQAASDLLDEFGVANEARVLSAHRTPSALSDYLQAAEAGGVSVFIAGAGGAAHLPGVVASQTVLPVIGVPIPTALMGGLDSLLSIVQMPSGVPVATMALGKAGAVNAALFALSILGGADKRYQHMISDYRARRAETLLEQTDPAGK